MLFSNKEVFEESLKSHPISNYLQGFPAEDNLDHEKSANFILRELFFQKQKEFVNQKINEAKENKKKEKSQIVEGKKENKLELFVTKNHKRTLPHYFCNLHDSKSVKLVWNSIHEIMVKQALKESRIGSSNKNN